MHWQCPVIRWADLRPLHYLIQGSRFRGYREIILEQMWSGSRKRKWQGCVTELVAAVNKMEAAGLDCPTAFEIETVMAYCQMVRWHVDVAVIEVGMGGRNDATNIIEKPALTVFTKISRDHTAFLGDTIEEIAYRKFGIIKAGCPVVSVRQDNTVMEMLKEICQHRGVKTAGSRAGADPSEGFFSGKTLFRYQGYPLEIRQLGYYQPENAVIAFEALKPMAQTDFIRLISARSRRHFGRQNGQAVSN